MTDYKKWLDNEYSLWVKALQESTVHNFKEHPMVKRMLSEVEKKDWRDVCDLLFEMSNPIVARIQDIDCIGRQKYSDISGTCLRMVYYALEVLKRNPSSIVEIGGGVGQFYAILRALGYNGEYYIFDLPEVQEFQYKYLHEVEKQTGLSLPIVGIGKLDFCVSFYALGEFNNGLKENYMNLVVNDCPHGYIAWNPHSGSTDDLSLFTHDIKVTEGREPNIKILEW